VGLLLAQCSAQLLMAGINQRSTQIACKDSDNGSDKAHECYRKHGRFIFNMESCCFASQLFKKKKKKSGQSLVINCCSSSLIQSLLNQKKNTSTFQLLEENMKKVKTLSYYIVTSDAHKYVSE